MMLCTTRRGIFFKFAGSAGYFLKWAGFRLDIGWVSQLMETQLASIVTYCKCYVSNGYHKILGDVKCSADSNTLALKTENDDITTFFGLQKMHRCLRYQRL